MPIVGFICPDGVKTKVEECFQKCRLEEKLKSGRCKAIPFLRKVARNRIWDGIPSTTQLLSGTRETYLKVHKPYYIDPDRKTAALIGTGVHSLLYKLIDSSSEKAEETIYNELLQGTYDMYDPETKTLYDYKTWGVWKLVKVLKGTPSEAANALFEVVLQLHAYKGLLQEKYPELQIKRLAVQIISRETNLSYAKKMGITYGSPLIVLPDISQELVREYFGIKKEKLELATMLDWAPVCNQRENWNSRKCDEFCEVKDLCVDMPVFSQSVRFKELDTIQEDIERTIIEQLANKEVVIESTHCGSEKIEVEEAY